jgi:hypothetical protein
MPRIPLAGSVPEDLAELFAAAPDGLTSRAGTPAEQIADLAGLVWWATTRLVKRLRGGAAAGGRARDRRSLVIPLQAAAMNLLSVASLGVAVAVFQHGRLGGLFNVRAGPIEASIRVILFAIVSGLSMDYEVFLDAFVVRSLLPPAALTLLGRRTWALPGPFERRLPRIAIEPAAL